MELVVIDGYNLMSWLSLLASVERKEISLEKARQKLVVEILANPKLAGKELKLFFDGKKKGRSRGEKIKRTGGGILEIVFCRNVDEVIKDLVLKKYDSGIKGIIVITRDRDLREEVRWLGAQVHYPAKFFPREKSVKGW